MREEPQRSKEPVIAQISQMNLSKKVFSSL